MPVYTLKHYYVWKSGSHLRHEAERERQSEWALNSSRDTRTDSKPGLLTWLQTWVILYSNMLSRLSGQTVSDCKHIKDKIKSSLWVSKIYSASIYLRFLWFLYMTQVHLHTFPFLQLIINMPLSVILQAVIFQSFILKISRDINLIWMT